MARSALFSLDVAGLAGWLVICLFLVRFV